jgi:hypothetical protein
MPTEIDPNALTLALILTAAGVAPAAALVTGLVSLLGNLGSFVAGKERLFAFVLSAVLVVFAYAATAVTVSAVTGFGAFLAWYGIARLSMATYDDIKGKANSLRGVSAP